MIIFLKQKPSCLLRCGITNIKFSYCWLCPACLVRLTWIVFVIGGRWPYSSCLVGCCCQDLFRMYSYGSPHMAAQKQDDQHERTFSSYVRIQVVVLKTCLGRWTTGRSGERGSGISVLPARYDDDDDDDCWLFSYIHVHITYFPTTYGSSSETRLKNTPTASLQRGKYPTNECPGFDTKQS